MSSLAEGTYAVIADLALELQLMVERKLYQ